MTLAATTSACRRDGRKALVAFLTAGYPTDTACVETALAATRAGCDVIELGVPFSDPIADGPVIQSSSTAALRRGVTLARTLELARNVSSQVETPVVIMSYLNPILSFGLERFADAGRTHGVSGVILPDVPLEESQAARTVVRGAGMDYVDLVAPTSTDERIAAIAAQTTGFLYLVAVTGVTGSRTAVAGQVRSFVERVRRHTNVPAYVGFGVSTPSQAAAVCRVADGVIIGSQLIRIMDEAGRDGSDPAMRVGAFISKVRSAIDLAA